jgi:CheY-like chemotaxis protein
MKRLLLVEDHPAVLRAVRRVLSGHYQVDVAVDAEAAAALLEQHAYDAVLSDFELPDQDGLWVLERARERRPAARRVLTSAHPASRFDGALVIERFVQKPATVEELLVALEA